MRLRGTALVMAIVVLLAAGGCTDDGGRATNVGAEQESTPTSVPTFRPLPVYKDGELPPPPVGPGAEVGREYPFQLHTHCGIEWARIDGVWWKTTPKLHDGSGNPPRDEEWGNPFDDGTVSLLDHDTAEYVSASGNRVRFARTTESPEGLCV